MVQEWEGRLNVGMSNSVTTAIRESVRDMAIEIKALSAPLELDCSSLLVSADETEASEFIHVSHLLSPTGSTDTW